MAYLAAPDLSGPMGIDNGAVLVPVSILDLQPVALNVNTIVSPTADMLRDLTEPGIQSAPIFG